MKLRKSVQQYQARWGGKLANHMPMAALSLQGLGFGVEVQQSFVEFYKQRLDILPQSAGRISSSNWQMFLGNYDYLSDYESYFRLAIEQEGLHIVLEKHIPILASGVIADAFHPLIRLGFGLDFSVVSEQAMGLAYWASVFDERPIPNSGRLRDWSEMLFHLQQLGVEPISGGLITKRLDRSIENPQFVDLVTGDVFQSLSLTDLREMALRMHWQRNNIVTLHAITALHAARLLMVHFPKSGSVLLPHLAYGLTAMYLAEGSPDLVDFTCLSGVDWSEIKQEILGSTNDHQIKLIYSCQEEEVFYGDVRYRIIAARESGLWKESILQSA